MPDRQPVRRNHRGGEQEATPRYWSVRRLAVRWDVSERTVRRAIERGRLRTVWIEGQQRVTPEEVDRYESLSSLSGIVQS